MKFKIGQLILLAEEGFKLQRATIIEIDKKNEVLTFCVLPQDREKGDIDGLGEGGFEDIYLLTPLTK